MHTLGFETALYIVRELTALFRKQLVILKGKQMKRSLGESMCRLADALVPAANGPYSLGTRRYMPNAVIDKEVLSLRPSRAKSVMSTALLATKT